MKSAFEMLDFIGDTVPLFGIWQRIFALCDVRPGFCKFSIQFNVLFLTRRYFIF